MSGIYHHAPDTRISKGINLPGRIWNDVEGLAQARHTFHSRIVEEALDLYFKRLRKLAENGVKP